MSPLNKIGASPAPFSLSFISPSSFFYNKEHAGNQTMVFCPVSPPFPEAEPIGWHIAPRPPPSGMLYGALLIVRSFFKEYLREDQSGSVVNISNIGFSNQSDRVSPHCLTPVFFTKGECSAPPNLFLTSF